MPKERLILQGLIGVQTNLFCPTDQTPTTSVDHAALSGGFTAFIGPHHGKGLSRHSGLGSAIDVGFHISANPPNSSILMGEDCFFAFTFDSQALVHLSSKEKMEVFKSIMENMNPDKPMILSAQDPILEEAVRWSTTYSRRLHVNQVTTSDQVEIISRAKERNPGITSDTTIYQLFLAEDRAKELQDHDMSGLPLPTFADQKALWNGIKSGTIDMISLGLTPLGTLGAELTLPLLLHAVSKGRLSYSGNRSLFHLLHYRPKEIFGISRQVTSPAYTVINLGEKYVLDHTKLMTPCSWMPFDGLQIVGKVEQVVLGATVTSNYRDYYVTPMVIFEEGEFVDLFAGGLLLPGNLGNSGLEEQISGISPSLRGLGARDVDLSDFTPTKVVVSRSYHGLSESSF